MFNSELLELLKELSWEYEAVGIRVQDVPFKLGPCYHKRHVWIEGEETEEELPGICAIKWSVASRYISAYLGDHMAIIVGNRWEYGEDPGEIIISDPQVVKIIY